VPLSKDIISTYWRHHRTIQRGQQWGL